MCNWFSSSLEFIYFFCECVCVQKSGLCVAVFLVVTRMMFVNTNVKKLRRREREWERASESERGRQKEKISIQNNMCGTYKSNMLSKYKEKGVFIRRCSCWIELLYKLFTERSYKKPLEMVVFRRMAYFDSCVSTSNISIRTRMHVSFVNIRSFNIMLWTLYSGKKNLRAIFKMWAWMFSLLLHMGAHLVMAIVALNFYAIHHVLRAIFLYHVM